MSALLENDAMFPAKPATLIAVEPALVMPQLAKNRFRVDVDFSLAIHNRTGKYFIGEQLLAMPDLSRGHTYYWWSRAEEPPLGLFGRILGRLQHLQIVGRTIGGPFSFLPRRTSQRPLLHLDPFTVPSTVLHARDAVLIHDLGPLTHPELFDPEVCGIYRHIYEEIAHVGPHLIFVSHASQREFERLFPGFASNSVRVIPPPIRPALSTIRHRKPDIEMPARFLLTVGSIGRRKNQLHSIMGYARSGLADQGVGYVVCGGREPFYEEVEELARRTPGVILLPYVPDDVLSWLYANATGFVLMSLLEGFGIPVSEAVRHGLVPLLSHDSALTEVAGPAAFQADPFDADEIGARMNQLANLSEMERIDRLEQLWTSVERFDLPHFQRLWRAAFRDIVKNC
jgi:glycosyltransferase involved in cell wall biosynthesis